MCSTCFGLSLSFCGAAPGLRSLAADAPAARAALISLLPLPNTTNVFLSPTQPQLPHARPSSHLHPEGPSIHSSTQASDKQSDPRGPGRVAHTQVELGSHRSPFGDAFDTASLAASARPMRSAVESSTRGTLWAPGPLGSPMSSIQTPRHQIPGGLVTMGMPEGSYCTQPHTLHVRPPRPTNHEGVIHLQANWGCRTGHTTCTLKHS